MKELIKRMARWILGHRRPKPPHESPGHRYARHVLTYASANGQIEQVWNNWDGPAPTCIIAQDGHTHMVLIPHLSFPDNGHVPRIGDRMLVMATADFIHAMVEVAISSPRNKPWVDNCGGEDRARELLIIAIGTNPTPRLMSWTPTPA